jgi:iron complex outermembrane receptor protein
LDFISDSFKEDKTFVKAQLDYHNFTIGAFIQDEWKLSRAITFQTGLRTDYHNKYGTFVLPYLASLYKLNEDLYVRASGGLGYKVPTVFSDATDKAGYENALPLGNLVKAETSEGFNLDINYKGTLSDEVIFTINQAFYYTTLNNPLYPQSDSLAKGVLFYANEAGQLEARGFDTDIMLILDELVLSIDYTYTDAKKRFDADTSPLELTPRHKVNITISYEVEKNWRTGIEAFYTGRQYLNDGTPTRDYWTAGFMIEKLFEDFSIIGNIENMFDVRQTRFENIVIPPYTRPSFRQIYAPLDGIVANVALRIRF